MAGVAAGALTIALSGCATPVPHSLPAELQPTSFAATAGAPTEAWPRENGGKASVIRNSLP